MHLNACQMPDAWRRGVAAGGTPAACRLLRGNTRNIVGKSVGNRTFPYMAGVSEIWNSLNT